MFETAPNALVDELLDGRLRLRQFRTGHRAGTDAVLLAAAAAAEPDERFVDVGAGAGAVGLAIAIHQPHCSGVLVEQDAATADLAAGNIDDNQMTARVRVVCLDVFDRAACRATGLVAAASLVVTNPPFYRGRSVRASTDGARARAHVLGDAAAGHADWLVRAASLLRPRGRLLAIHRPDALQDLLRACEGRLGNLLVCPIHPRADAPAHRILLGGIHGARGPLTILPRLVLHCADGRFTPEAEALHRGATLPFWPEKSRPRRAGSNLVRSPAAQ